MVFVWIAICIVLLAVEMHHLAFFALFGAVGAAAAAVVALVVPHSVAVQVVVAIGVAAMGVVAVRPLMSRAFARREHGLRIGGVHGGLVGARGVTVDEVAVDAHGHVRLLGETWLAVPGSSWPIPPATPVIIVDVVGTTLTVKAVADELERT